MEGPDLGLGTVFHRVSASNRPDWREGPIWAKLVETGRNGGPGGFLEGFGTRSGGSRDRSGGVRLGARGGPGGRFSHFGDRSEGQSQLEPF